MSLDGRESNQIEQIITYDTATHERMFEMGRSDAARVLRDMTPGSHSVE